MSKSWAFGHVLWQVCNKAVHNNNWVKCNKKCISNTKSFTTDMIIMLWAKEIISYSMKQSQNYAMQAFQVVDYIKRSLNSTLNSMKKSQNYAMKAFQVVDYIKHSLNSTLNSMKQSQNYAMKAFQVVDYIKHSLNSTLNSMKTITKLCHESFPGCWLHIKHSLNSTLNSMKQSQNYAMKAFQVVDYIKHSLNSAFIWDHRLPRW